MSKSRLEAFTDAVIAIVMTILVLQFSPPKEATFEALFALRHKFLIYFVSFIMLAVYWNNHHHLFQLVKKVNGKVLWANNFFILSLSLFPFATAWLGDHLLELAPELTFGFVSFFANLMYLITYIALSKTQAIDKRFESTMKSNVKKMYLSNALNILALFAGVLIHPLATLIINLFILVPWFIPDKKAEKHYE